MEILSTEVMSGLTLGWSIIGTVLILVGVFGILLFLIGVTEGEGAVLTIGLVLAVVGFGLVAVINSNFSYEYEQHKVTITDFNEVHKQGYEIIEQEGEIYTVQKKGADSQ